MSCSESLYIHIPYCARKCRYCDFNSHAEPSADHPRYLRALLAECAAWNVRTPPTIFLGGGTPSLVRPTLLAAFLDELDDLTGYRGSVREFSVEANPESLTPELLSALMRGGMTRLSLGFQALDDPTLQFFGRIHDARTAIEAYRLARVAGVPAINVDLIMGAPPQRDSGFLAGLEEVIELAPQHLSVYDLHFEPGTALGILCDRGTLAPRDDRERARLYLAMLRRLRRAGYQRYEISAFARSAAHRCQHNLTYWRNAPYVGLGAGAASYRGGIRSTNLSDPALYMHSVERSGRASEFSERLAPRRLLAETLMLRLRVLEPIDLDELARQTGAVLDREFPGLLERLIRQGLLRREARAIALTRRGQRLLDSIVAAIFEAVIAPRSQAS